MADLPRQLAERFAFPQKRHDDQQRHDGEILHDEHRHRHSSVLRIQRAAIGQHAGHRRGRTQGDHRTDDHGCPPIQAEDLHQQHGHQHREEQLQDADLQPLQSEGDQSLPGQFQTDREQQQRHADLGRLLHHRRARADDVEDARADQHAGQQRSDDRAQTNPLEQHADERGGAEQNHDVAEHHPECGVRGFVHVSSRSSVDGHRDCPHRRHPAVDTSPWRNDGSCHAVPS